MICDCLGWSPLGVSPKIHLFLYIRASLKSGYKKKNWQQTLLKFWTISNLKKKCDSVPQKNCASQRSNIHLCGEILQEGTFIMAGWVGIAQKDIHPYLLFVVCKTCVFGKALVARGRQTLCNWGTKYTTLRDTAGTSLAYKSDFIQICNSQILSFVKSWIDFTFFIFCHYNDLKWCDWWASRGDTRKILPPRDHRPFLGNSFLFK